MARIEILLISVVLSFSFGQSVGQIKNKQLTDKFVGRWVNTSLFDSTSIKRKLSPWIGEFYGAAELQISRDSVLLLGCVDGGAIENVRVITDLSFTTSDIGESKFEYLKNSDLILMTKANLRVIFRRVKTTDRLDIRKDEHKFESYFRSLFFDKYLEIDKYLRIDELWVGFGTYAPFEFDAFGVRSKNGDVEYFGWELTKNTLRIYQTTRNTDNDSGFYFWTKGKLQREIRLK